MTAFWTLLVVLYATEAGEAQGLVMLPSQRECVRVMNALGETLPNPRSHHIACEPTGILSSSPRPRARPWKDGEK